ncbi:MAG: TIGR03936 family radical SAM-associated protein, partial [Candidatus Saccharicenans sp.]
GYDDLSLNALSIGDYPYLEESIEQLLPYLELEKISVSLPSLRPGRLSRKIVENIVKIRKTGFTLVPEAGSERLRRVINKKISDQELFTAARYAYEHGWRLLKLYFMIGLPTETAEDLKAIIRLIGQLVDLSKETTGNQPAINLSISSFIPKPHTPFQWLAMEEERLLQEKQEYIKDNIRRWRKIELKEHRIKTSILEAVFSRGDRRLGAVLKEAYQQGARFDGWLDLFNFEIWERAFEKNGLDYKNYLKSIDLEADLPWDIVNIGLKKSYLKEELKAAEEARQTISCQEKDCGSCQACYWPEFKAYQREIQRETIPKKIEIMDTPLEEPIRYRAAYQKTGLARFISHNDLLNQLERAFRRSGIKMGFSQGFHPKMLMSHGPALPLGLAARAEVMEFKARESLTPESFLARINSALPEGLKFIGIKKCPDSWPSLFQDLAALVYTLD